MKKLFFAECVALFDYAGQEVGDLPFQQGDVITVLAQEEESEWWEGTLNGNRGMFPANYVKVRESSAVISSQVEPSTPDVAPAAVVTPVEHIAQVSF